MADIPKRVWHKYLRPQLQKMGIDVRRHPPNPAPHWTEAAFDAQLGRRALPQAFEESGAQAFLGYCLQHTRESYSQLLQDLFVRWHLRDKTNGFYVDFGAANGVDLSNTKLLEEKLEWRGILAEPARCWHDQLKRNRSGIVDTRCVWHKSGEILAFNETAMPELSTLQCFSGGDHHAQARENGKIYPVETVSLNDLLAAYDAPSVIDYLSVDTEGSELSILKAFAFAKYHVAVITVEHNYTPDRERLFELLTGHGFTRLFTQFTKQDDWYVNTSAGPGGTA